MKPGVIIGWAHSRFGRHEAPDLESLIRLVAPQALEHAGVSPEEVDGVFVGAMNAGFSRQGFEGALPALAVPGLHNVPAVHVENACSSGSAALYAALDFIAAGRGRVALVVGAEKMTHMASDEVGDVLLAASYRKEEDGVVGGFAGLFGEIASEYFDRYGDCAAELGMIAAKNHANGVHNPYAHMRKDLGVEFCSTVSAKNPLVAAPLRRTDCSMISDGAAALVVASADVGASASRAVAFRSRHQVNDYLPLSRRDRTAFTGARLAWQRALTTAGVDLLDLDLVETHDCFTIAELIEYEAMGLAEVGQGARVVRESVTQRGGRLPVNPSGGLKAKGHPIGATGVSQHVLAAMQLTGDAGDMQIGGAQLAGVFNMGGVAVANYVSILERSR
jgi:acetyl-CoA C-acetyltransferase